MSKLGLNNETRTTGAKKFTVNETIGGGTGIAQGTITNVEVSTYTAKDDTKLTSFKGLEVPRITFTLEQTGDFKGGLYFKSFNALEYDSVFKDGEASWQVRNMLAYIGHFYEALTGNPVGDANINLNITDKKALDGAKTCAAFQEFFDAIGELFNGKGNAKGIYADVPLHIKMLLYDSNGPVNKGHAALPMFPNDGVIQKYVEGEPTTLKVNQAQGESVKEREYAAEPSAMPSAGAPKSKWD